MHARYGSSISFQPNTILRLVSYLAALTVTMVALPVWAQTSSPPAPTQLPSIALAPELDRVLRDYEAAWRRGDAAALSALFAADGFVMQHGKPPVRGRAAIQAAYQGNSGGSLKLRAFAVATADTIGYIVGAYGYDGDAADMGKFTLTLKRVRGGKWLIFSDMDNASRATRPPAE